MQIETDVIDVLPDGTITRLILKTEPMTVTICRKEPDQNFMIEKMDVINRDHIKEATEALAVHLREYCIFNIDINCVDGSRAILNI